MVNRRTEIAASSLPDGVHSQKRLQRAANSIAAKDGIRLSFSPEIHSVPVNSIAPGCKRC
jgi:hypothetical protein